MSVMTATTEVVISEKLKLELASVELSGTDVSRMSTMRIVEPRHPEARAARASKDASRQCGCRPNKIGYTRFRMLMIKSATADLIGPLSLSSGRPEAGPVGGRLRVIEY